MATTSATTETAANGRDDSVVLVPLALMPDFDKRLASLNKKAATFGLDPIKVITAEDRLYKRVTEQITEDKYLSTLVALRAGEYEPHPIKVKLLHIEYPKIKLGNWQVVGKLERIGDENLIFTVSQNPDDAEAVRSRAEHRIECDHCKTKRARKDGFVLRDNDTGKYTQVGSNCLKDFTGIDPAAALFLARVSMVVRVAEDEWGAYGSSGRNDYMDTDTFLANVAFLSNHGGFVSSARSNELGISATYTDATNMDRIFLGDPSLRQKYRDEWDDNYAKAQAARAWVLDKPIQSDFDHNVKLILRDDIIDLERKKLAFSAAVIPMHTRHLGQVAEREQRAPSTHIGMPGQKMVGQHLTIDRIFETPGYAYGSTLYFVLMSDPDGNKVKWRTGAPPQEVIEGKGRTMEATFKVKEHADYKGTAQTVVTHLNVTRWLDLELAKPAAPTADIEKMSISVFRHPYGDKADFTHREIDNKQLAPAQMQDAAASCIAILRSLDGAGKAAKWMIPEAATLEHVWYVTEHNANNPHRDTFSLHIHDVDGREPVSGDYRRIADMLGVAGGPWLATDEEPEADLPPAG